MTVPEFSIHQVTEENSSLMENVDDDVFDEEVQPALLQAFLANPGNLLFVAMHEGQVVGMASGLPYVHPDKPLQLFVNEVGVSARFHRHGLGTRLLTAILQRGRELGCHEAWVATEVGNTPARALYSSAGGKEDDEHAIVYVYSLK